MNPKKNFNFLITSDDQIEMINTIFFYKIEYDFNFE